MYTFRVAENHSNNSANGGGELFEKFQRQKLNREQLNVAGGNHVILPDRWEMGLGF